MNFSYKGPFKSNRKNKKFYVIVTMNNKTKIIHFGDSRYESYDQHGDEKRRKNYLARAKGIRDKNGKLTYKNPLSSNYWAINYLW